jgi:lysophospholipase L1-like esterase
MAHILVFGDSITYGAWDKEGGWVQRLREFLDEKRISNPDVYYLTYNLGISGETTEGFLKRLEFETKQRLWEKEEIIFIFQIGGNDAAFLHEENRLWVPLEKYKENLKRSLEIAKKFSSKIIFLGLLPVDETRTTPLSWNPISHKNEYAKKFNDTLRSFCKENNIYFIEIFEELIKTDYPKLLEDGLHPNSEGHKKIFKITRDFFIKLEGLS